MAVSRSFSDKVAAYLNGDPASVYAALLRWAPFEGSKAAYNPLATTQPSPGASNFNSAGVKNYPSEQAGAYATAVTLENGYYPDLLNWVKTGSLNNESGIVQQLRKWGTTNFADVFRGATVGGPVGIGGSAGGGITFPSASILGDILDKTGTVVGHVTDFVSWEHSSDPAWQYFVDASGNVIDKGGTIVGHVADAASAVPDALGSIADSLSSAKDIFLWLLDPHHWFRLFFIAAGIGMIVLGSYIYVRGDNAIGDASKVAQLGAMGAE